MVAPGPTLSSKCTIALCYQITITSREEASILNFAALNIRQAHERPEDMEEGGVMMVGLAWEQICEGLTIPKAQFAGSARSLRIVQDSNIPNVSQHSQRIGEGATDYRELLGLREPVWYGRSLTWRN